MKSPAVCLSIVVSGILFTAGCQQAAQRAASLAPNVPVVGRPHKDFETRFSIARVQEQQGQLRSAKERYLALQKEAPKNAEIPHRLGIIASRSGQHDKAQEHFKRSLTLSPHNAEVLSDWGYSLFLQGKLEDAEAVLRQALEESPGHTRSTNNLALALGHAGRVEESFTMFRQANGEAAAWLNLGYIHANLAQAEKAAECFSRALTHDNDLEAAAHALVQIAEMKSDAERRNANQARMASKTPAIEDTQSGVVQVSLEQESTESATVIHAKHNIDSGSVVGGK